MACTLVHFTVISQLLYISADRITYDSEKSLLQHPAGVDLGKGSQYPSTTGQGEHLLPPLTVLLQGVQRQRMSADLDCHFSGAAVLILGA